MAELTQFPIAHPIREVLRELGSAAQRGIAYDAGRALLSAATDPDLDGETIERYLNRADEEFEYRVRQCERDLPTIAENARTLRALSREVVGPSAREYDSILRDVRALFPEYATIRAVHLLGAEPVGGGRFAYRDATAGRWHTMNGEQLLHLRQIAAGYPGNIEDLAPWREYALMPEWWSPERQSAWRIDSDSRVRNELDFTLRFQDEGEAQYAADTAARDFAQRRDSIRVERVTADLTTGEEVVLQDEQNVNRRRLPETSVFGFAKEVLGAVEIAPGRFAFYDRRSETHWSVGAAAIAEFDRALDDARRDVRECERHLALAPADEKESAQLRADEARQKADPERVFWNWASTPGTKAVEMPSWWTPQRQTAYRLDAPGVYEGPRYWTTYQQAVSHGGRDPKITLVTADPVTGKEKLVAESAGRDEIAMTSDDPNVFAEHVGKRVHLTFVEDNALGSEFIDADYRFIETEVGAQFNGGYRFVFEDEDGIRQYLFPFDIASYSFEQAEAVNRHQEASADAQNAADMEAAKATFAGEPNAARLLFHFENGGHNYDPQTETRLEGRMRCAREAAAAESIAKERGWKLTVEESGEQYGWQDGTFDVVSNPARFSGELFTGYNVALYDTDENMLASLGGVTFKDDNEYEPYRDVLYAELAQEALENEEGVNRHALPTDSLSRAIERLGAVEVAEGRYAFNADDYPRVPDGKAESRWMICSGERLTELASDPYDEEQYGNYWEDRTVIQPRWWTPEQRFAWRYSDGARADGGIATTGRTPDEVRSTVGADREHVPGLVVTADLTTGEEVVLNDADVNRHALPVQTYPEFAFAVLRSDPTQVIAIKANEPGYHPYGDPMPNERAARQYADELNERGDVTPAMRAAMEAGSMFGWDTPAADPSGLIASKARTLIEEMQVGEGDVNRREVPQASDVAITSDQSVCIVAALTNGAREWVAENVDMDDMMGDEAQFYVERNYVEAIALGMLEAGLSVEVDNERVTVGEVNGEPTVVLANPPAESAVNRRAVPEQEGPDSDPEPDKAVNHRAFPQAGPAPDASLLNVTQTREGEANMAEQQQAAQQKKHPTNSIYLTGALEYDPKVISTPNGTDKIGLRLKVVEPGYSFSDSAGNETVVPDKEHYFSCSVVGDKGRDAASQLHAGDQVTVRGKAETYLNKETKRPAIGVTAFDVTTPTKDDLANPNRMQMRGKITEAHVSERRGQSQFSFVEYKVQPFAAPGAKPTVLTVREYTPEASALAAQRQPGAVVALDGKWAIQVFQKQSGEKVETHTIATTPKQVQVLESERGAALQTNATTQAAAQPVSAPEAAAAVAAAAAAAPTPVNAKATTPAQVVREREYMQIDGTFIGVKSLQTASGEKEPFAVVTDNDGQPFLFRDTDAFSALTPGEKAHISNGPDGLSVAGENAQQPGEAGVETVQISSDDLSL